MARPHYEEIDEELRFDELFHSGDNRHDGPVDTNTYHTFTIEDDSPLKNVLTLGPIRHKISRYFS